MAAKLPAMDESVLNMTPMIDIVFQLILFFLFSLKFKDVQYRFDAELPRDRGEPKSFTVVDEHPRLTVSLFRLDEIDPAKARTKIKFSGAEWIVPAGATLDERDKIYASLQARISRESKALAIAEGEIKTPLPTGASVPHADVMKVLDAFWALDLLDVKFEGAPPPLSRARPN